MGCLYYYLTVLFGIETYEAHLKCCKKAKKLFIKQKGKVKEKMVRCIVTAPCRV